MTALVGSSYRFGLCLAAMLVSACVHSAGPMASAADVNGELPPDLRQLWDLTEVRRTPLDPEVVEEREVDGFLVRGVYFSSEQTPKGPNRIYCGYARPVGTQKKPPLIVVHGGGGHGSTDTALEVSKLLRVPVISMDWSGELPGTEFGSRFADPTPATSTVTGKTSLGWHIVVAIRRTIDYLETLPEIDLSRVVVFGGSWGSYYGHLATCTDPRITDFVGSSGAGGWDDSFSIVAAGIQTLPREIRAEFLETFDPAVYAPYCRARVTMLAPANDEFFWFGGLVRNFNAYTQSADRRLVVHCNNNHGIGGDAPPIPSKPVPVPLLRYHLGAAQNFPKLIGGIESDGAGTRFRWKTPSDSQAEQTAKLYWSPGKVNWRSRYWKAFDAERVGEDWFVELPADFVGVQAVVLATVFAGDGRAVSTTPLDVAGNINPQVNRGPFWKETAIWDVEKGASAWRATSTFEPSVAIVDHPAGGIEISPTNRSGRFSVLTNSVLLASGHASAHSGLSLSMDAGDESGELAIIFRRDTGLESSETRTALIRYAPAEQTIEIPWEAFTGATPTLGGAPIFDTLVLEGMRTRQQALVVKAINFFKRP